VSVKYLRKIDYVIFFLAFSTAVLSVQYMKGGFKLIIFHDSPYPIDPISMVSKFSSIWRDIANFGFYDPTGVPLTFLYLLISPLQLLFGDNVLIPQFLFLLTIFNIALLSMYFLSKEIGLSKKNAILSSILYIANPYSIFYVWRILNTNLFLYAVAPSIILSILKIVDCENVKKYCLLLLIGAVFAFPAFANPAWYVSLLIVSFVISLSWSVIRRLNLKLLMRTLLTVSVFLILPFIGYFSPILFFQNPFTISSSIESAMMFFKFNTQHINLLRIFSLTNLSPLYEEVKWYPFEEVYRSDVLSMVFGVFVGCIIAILLFTKEQKSYPFIVTIITLSALSLPTTGLFIMEKIPWLLLAFRDPSHKLGWGIALSLALLIPLGLQKVKLVLLKKKLSIVAFLLALILLSYWSFPIFTGQFVPLDVKNGNLNFSAFGLPNEYMEAISYIKQDEDTQNGARVLIYPFASILWSSTEGYWGNDILRFSGISTISTLAHVNFRGEEEVLLNLQDQRIINDLNYVNYISRLGIKYILVRKDFCENYLQPSVRFIIESLSNKSNLMKIIENNCYILFKVINQKSTLFSLIIPSEPLNKSFKVNFDELEGVSTPIFFNWSLEKRGSAVILRPLDGATNYTWIDMNYLSFNDDSYYDFIRVEISNSTGITNVVLSFRSKEGESGFILPCTISLENETVVYLFKINKLEGIRPSDLNRIFINFNFKTPQSVFVKSFEFLNTKLSFRDFLTSLSLSYKKLSSTQYIVNLPSNINKKPFYLIFSESYDPGWKVYISGQQIPEENHFIAIGFANGWYINNVENKDHKESSEILIEYAPQKWFCDGLVVSLLIFTGCVLYLAKETLYRLVFKIYKLKLASIKSPKKRIAYLPPLHMTFCYKKIYGKHAFNSI